MELLCREWQGVNVCNFHFSVMFDLGGSISSADLHSALGASRSSAVVATTDILPIEKPSRNKYNQH